MNKNELKDHVEANDIIMDSKGMIWFVSLVKEELWVSGKFNHSDLAYYVGDYSWDEEGYKVYRTRASSGPALILRMWWKDGFVPKDTLWLLEVNAVEELTVAQVSKRLGYPVKIIA